MFFWRGNDNIININNLNVSGECFSGLFEECNNLKSVNNFTISNTFANIFTYCSNLISISNLKLENVTFFSLCSCDNLKDISFTKDSHINRMLVMEEYFLSDCSNLTENSLMNIVNILPDYRNVRWVVAPN